VRAGDRIVVEKESTKPPPAECPLTILWQSEAILAIDKPFGLPFAPTRSGVEGTLLYTLARSLSRPLVELHPVHRLDTPTSGVVLVALNRGTAEHLSKAFREHRVTKRYLAWVEGAPSPPSGAWHRALTTSEGRTRVDPGGKTAVTEYRIAKRRMGFSQLELSPRTGRMHQLRVHCADAGHPIVGDRKYGSEIKGPRRVLLHSWKIRFPLADGTLQEVVSPVPRDIEEFPSLVPPTKG
jgi:23S rRNA pseudouridine1911/1915/1917 synthase